MSHDPARGQFWSETDLRLPWHMFVDYASHRPEEMSALATAAW